MWQLLWWNLDGLPLIKILFCCAWSKYIWKSKGIPVAPSWLLLPAAQCWVYGLSGRKSLWCSADRPFPSLWLHCGPVPDCAHCVLLEYIAMQPGFGSYPMPRPIVLRAQEFVFQLRPHELPTASEERAPGCVRELYVQSGLFPLWVTCHWNLTERGDCQGSSEPCIYLADEKWLCERLPQAHHAQHGFYWWYKLPSEKAPIPGVYWRLSRPVVLWEKGTFHRYVLISGRLVWFQVFSLVNFYPLSLTVLNLFVLGILFWLTSLYTVFWEIHILGILSWGIQFNAASINCQKNHCVWDTSQRTELCTTKHPFGTHVLDSGTSSLSLMQLFFNPYGSWQGSLPLRSLLSF